MEYENDYSYIRDNYSRLILNSARSPKSAIAISKETKISLGTVYRRLEILKKYGFLKISGKIENGNKVMIYYNKPKRYHVQNPRISYILDIIDKNPGLSFRDLQRFSGYPMGTLSNSLSNLEKDSKIIVKRSKRRSNYFPRNISPSEFPTLINLRKETSRRIILFLVENQKGTFSEIRNFANKSPSTVSLTLTNLIENNIIRRVSGLRPYFELQNIQLIHNALMRSEPNTIDKMKDRFADTFSYL
ncbi:transcriptional regulator TrmB protein [Marine Group I thaumarchaeote SCGC AAA799-B03]|uniref:Transcriptional regulator TrmB protein n=2 Tax=Marine Group I TaxID=905826 RepID=A0A087S5U6_9ARCH|nr:transcriptional regulator TrmB protein [Marine Group I thaumarchaeote SCGC AAA799-B03]